MHVLGHLTILHRELQELLYYWAGWKLRKGCSTLYVQSRPGVILHCEHAPSVHVSQLGATGWLLTCHVTCTHRGQQAARLLVAPLGWPWQRLSPFVPRALEAGSPGANQRKMDVRGQGHTCLNGWPFPAAGHWPGPAADARAAKRPQARRGRRAAVMTPIGVVRLASAKTRCGRSPGGTGQRSEPQSGRGGFPTRMPLGMHQDALGSD